MTEGIIRFTVVVDPYGYEIRRLNDNEIRHLEEGGVEGAEESGLWIAPLGVPFPEKKDELISLGQHDVFVKLANTDSSEKAVLSFVNRWGLSRGPRQRLSQFHEDKELLRSAAGERDVSKIATMIGSRGLGHLEIGFETKGSSVPSLVFTCKNLIDFCWLELLQVHVGGASILICEGCGKFLPVHRMGRPRKHCDDACRQEAYRKRRDGATQLRRCGDGNAHPL